MSVSLQTIPEFSVHVFVNHDPSIASVFLPDIFSDFPDSAWQLPQRVATPDPEVRPSRIPDDMLKELYVDPRKAIGRHVFQKPLKSSTTLRELAEKLEQEFNLDKKLLAKFTIYPQEFREDGTKPEWHDRHLPRNQTLNEVAMLDCDALSAGQYAENSEQSVPILHLVIETKAAALRKILGGIHGEEFLVMILGMEDDVQLRGDIWNRLKSFSNCYRSYERSEIVRALQQWRSACHSIRYIESEKQKLVAQEPVNESNLHALERNISKFQSEITSSRSVISALASQWENWVQNKQYSIDDSNDKELQDNDVEDKVKKILSQRTVVAEWGKSEKQEPLREMLRQAWQQGGKNSNSHQQQQSEISRPESGKAKTDKSEESLEVASNEEASSDLLENQAPLNRLIINTLSFRNADGTLDPELSRFSVESGVLSWGQVLPLYYGSLQDDLTNNANYCNEMLPGGTIKQQVYTYKSAARTGDWMVRRYYSTWRGEDPYDLEMEKSHVGWIVCHDDFNPEEIILRVKAIGTGGTAISNGNNHTDKYDWSYHWHHPQDPEFETKFRDWAAFPHEETQETEEQTQERLILEKKMAILDLRHKLQAGLLSWSKPVIEEDIPTMAEYILQLEQFPDLDAITIRKTNIHKVLKSIDKRGLVPLENQFRIKERCVRLLETWTELLSAEPTEAKTNDFGYEVEPLVAGVRKGGYFLAMDAEKFDVDFVRAYKSGCEVETGVMQEAVFTKGEQKFGTCVSFPQVEYEFAWLVFSGKRDLEHDADELIAIIYDGTYEVLEGLYHSVEREPDSMAA